MPRADQGRTDAPDNVINLTDRISADRALRHLRDHGLLCTESWRHVGLPRPPKWWPTRRQETSWSTAPTGTEGA